MNLVEHIGNRYHEIGSEFWTDCTPRSNHGEFTMRPKGIYATHSVIETLSGRTALEHIVELLVKEGKKTAYLPSYCCHTMIEPFLSHGVQVSFYDVVTDDGGLKRNVVKNNQADVILLMDYFGHTDSETSVIAHQQKEAGKTVIYDATHSLYSNIDYTPYDYVYGSYRKWIDINCGFLAKDGEFEAASVTQNIAGDEPYPRIRTELFDLKAGYMSGKAIEKSSFLDKINVAEAILEEQYHHKLPDGRSLDVLRTANADFIKYQRRLNADALIDGINGINASRIRTINAKLSPDDTPLFVPVLVDTECRDALRRHLVNDFIYCPIHWPYSEMHRAAGPARKLFDAELSLICDQRYGREDMDRITESIRTFFKDILTHAGNR